VKVMGSLPPRDPRVARCIARSKALIFPQEEDFGIVPLEAMISGKPVIAYRAGGALETVLEGRTGLFFDHQTVDSLIEAVKKFEQNPDFDPFEIHRHAWSFRKEVFEQKIKEFILENFRKFRSGNWRKR